MKDKQHYVPQFHLGKFIQRGQKKLYRFNKQTDEIDEINTKNTCYQNHFLTKKIDDMITDAERTYRKVYQLFERARYTRQIV